MPGERTFEQSDGQPIAQGIDVVKEPIEGTSLQTTLDREMQYQAQEALKEAVEANGAKSGTVIVMDVHTGDIYAMASYPWFDPNNYAHVAANDPARLRNPAVTDAFEPGSVNKVITAAAAIESGAVSVTQRFRVPDSMQVDQYTIHDSHTHPVETMTLADIVAESSNIGMAKVGGLVGKTTLASYLNRFGFGRTTGLGFPGESEGHRPGAVGLERRHARDHLLRAGRERHAAADGLRLRDGRERRRLGAAEVGQRNRGRLGDGSRPRPRPRRNASSSRRRRPSWRRCSRTSSRTGPGPARRSPATRSPARPGPR